MFAIVQKSSGGIELPDPANYTGKMIAVNNQYTSRLSFVVNAPINNSSIASGSGHLLLSIGNNWYVIGGR